MNRGEVWWVESPRDRRPFVILTRQSAIPVLERVVAAPASTTIRGAATEVPLDRGDGMPSECVLSLDNVELIPKHYFTTRICRLGPAKMHEICEALGRAVACS